MITVMFKDNTIGDVDPSHLEQLIISKKIQMFHRSDGWVDVAIGPLRESARRYAGPERRSIREAKFKINILLVEDNPVDAELIKINLSRNADMQINIERLDQLSLALSRVMQQKFDIILLDLMLPDSRGIESFAKMHAVAHDIPTIILSGIDDQTIALDAVHRGAQDYLVKGQFDSNLLTRAILYSIERHELLVELEKRTRELNTLKGIVPICSNCKRIRDEKGQWAQMEEYISQRSEALFSHSLCPQCAAKLLADIDELKQNND